MDYLKTFSLKIISVWEWTEKQMAEIHSGETTAGTKYEQTKNGRG